MSKKVTFLESYNNDFFDTYISQFNNFITKETQTTKNSGCILRTADKMYYSNKDLIMLQKIKKYISKTKDVLDKIYSYQKRYGDVLNTYGYCYQSGLFEQAHEVDISACYLHTAYLNGLIEKQFFDKIMRFDKLKRLKFLGAIATKKTVYTYENNKIVNIETKKPKEVFQVAWAYIVNRTHELMTNCIQDCVKSFLLFWVDAVFFHDDSEIEKIQEFFKKNGYNSKYIPLKNVFYSKENYKKGTVLKFNFQKENENKYIFLPNY